MLEFFDKNFKGIVIKKKKFSRELQTHLKQMEKKEAKK